MVCCIDSFFFWSSLMGVIILFNWWCFPCAFFILTKAVQIQIFDFLIAYIWMILIFLFLTIVASFLFFLIIWIVFYSISYLGIYKKLNTEDPLNGESFFQKIKNTYLLNAFLSIFLLLVVIYFLYPSDIATNSDLTSKMTIFAEIDYTYILSIAFIPAYLLSLRILANPTINVFYISIIEYYTHPSDKIQFIKSFKNGAISFYVSLTIGALIYLFLKLMQASMNHQLEAEMSKFHSHFDSIFTLVLITMYLIILFVTTVIGEYILKWYQPYERI
jgi:hypothetical protein